MSTFEFSRAEIRQLRWRAIRYLPLTSDEFSEYYLPFLIALLPVSVLVAQHVP